MPSIQEEKINSETFKDPSINPVWGNSLFTEEDIRNFQEGTHYTLYKYFGAHHLNIEGIDGFYFAVWAPNATFISVVGSFNNWNEGAHPLFVRSDSSGIWEGFIPGVQQGDVYKYFIHGYGGAKLYKGDPYARYWERRPQTGSVVWNDSYHWTDERWKNHSI